MKKYAAKLFPSILLIALLPAAGFQCHAFAVSQSSEEQDDDSALVTASLITASTAAAPGSTLLAGIHLEMKEGWYVYWQNPGDSGIPTKVEWTIPGGFSMSELRWPYPSGFFTDSFVSYGYKGNVVLLADMTVPEDAETGGRVDISADVSWLVCKDICIPGKATVTGDVAIMQSGSDSDTHLESDSDISANMGLLNEFRNRIPSELPGLQVSFTEKGNSLIIMMDHESLQDADVSDLTFFATEEGIVESGADQGFERTDTGLRVTLKKSVFANNDIKQVNGILYNAAGWNGNVRKAITVSTSRRSN
jgi:DsbC/DsbD-like thiol-disulfide interchange protein